MDLIVFLGVIFGKSSVVHVFSDFLGHPMARGSFPFFSGDVLVRCFNNGVLEVAPLSFGGC